MAGVGISQADWQGAEADPLGSSAAAIIDHMNDDHADAMALYCRAFSKATEITSASMTASTVRLRNVGAHSAGTTTLPSGVRPAAQHGGGGARR